MKANIELACRWYRLSKTAMRLTSSTLFAIRCGFAHSARDRARRAARLGFLAIYTASKPTPRVRP